MPTAYSRIQVTRDTALEEALRMAARVVGPDVKQATLVHDLAIKGAQRVVEEDRQRAESVDYLVGISTGRTGLDWDLLSRVDQEAWGIAPDAA